MPINKKIIFFTAEKGRDLPGTKRCHIIAEELKKNNYPTSVISSADYIRSKYYSQPNDIQKIISQIKIYNKIKSEKEAIFYIQRIDYHIIAPLLVSKINSNKIIIDIDDWALDANFFRGLSVTKFLNIDKIWEDVLERSDACVVISYKLKNLLENRTKNVIVIPPLMDVTKYKKQNLSENSGFIFCWIGTVYREDDLENINFIIKSFRKFKEDVKNTYPNNTTPEAYLDIVGGGPLFDKLRNNKSSDIRLKEWMTEKELSQYLENIEVGLIPLIQNINYNIYKIPTKLFDFMRFYKPVIVSDIGETGNFVKRNNLGIILNNDYKNWSNAFMDLYINHSKRHEMGKRAYKTLVDKYSLQNSIDKMKNLINNL